MLMWRREGIEVPTTAELTLDSSLLCLARHLELHVALKNALKSSYVLKGCQISGI